MGDGGLSRLEGYNGRGEGDGLRRRLGGGSRRGEVCVGRLRLRGAIVGVVKGGWLKMLEKLWLLDGLGLLMWLVW